MKRFSYLIFFFTFSFLFFSCSKETKMTKGVLKSFSEESMVLGIGDYDVTFDLSKSNIFDLALMAGDSLTVDYFGDLKSKNAEAIFITLIPRVSNVVVGVHPENELLLSDEPITEEEIVKMEEFNALTDKERSQKH